MKKDKKDKYEVNPEDCECNIPDHTERCGDISPGDIRKDGGWTCTLTKGHKGKHVACSVATHHIHTWE